MAQITGRSSITRAQLLRTGGTVLAASAIAACTRSGTEPGAASSRPIDRTQKDELIWLVWSTDSGARKEAHDAMVKRLTDTFPHVTVTRVESGSGQQNIQKLVTLFASGTRVDIIGTRPDYLPAYVEGINPLKDLREFLKTDRSVVQESDHVPAIVEGLTWKGTLYALPMGVYTQHVVVNLDLLAQQGIARPAAAWTVDHLVDIAQRTTIRRETEPESTWGYYHMWNGGHEHAYTWIRATGGEAYQPVDVPTRSRWSTEPIVVNTMQWLVDLSHKIRVMSVAPFGGSVGTFREGRATLCSLATNNLWQIVEAQVQGTAQFRWDVHPLPLLKQGRFQSINAFSYGISRASPNPAVAWELLKQMVGPAGQTDWYRLAKFAPSLKPLLNGSYLQEKDPPASKQVIVDALLASKPMPKSPLWLDMEQIVVEVLTRVRAGQVGVLAGLGDVDRRINALLPQK